MKTIIILVMISFYNGGAGGNIEVWKDMESCQEAKLELTLTHDKTHFYACTEITKEKMENPKGGKQL